MSLRLVRYGSNGEGEKDSYSKWRRFRTSRRRFPDSLEPTTPKKAKLLTSTTASPTPLEISITGGGHEQDTEHIGPQVFLSMTR